MKLHVHSYRFAEEILQHERFQDAWLELVDVFENAPLFIYPNKSKNKKLYVVQQVMNTYFDRMLSVEYGWEYHPLATKIADSNLQADFRKTFDNLTIQVEVQLGNMGRWYSDIFKFQAAYSQNITDLAVSVVALNDLATVIDSNVVNYERVLRELPSAELSITLPILVIGLEVDSKTKKRDLRKCKFTRVKQVKETDNTWRIVNGYLEGKQMRSIGPNSPIGPKAERTSTKQEDADDG